MTTDGLTVLVAEDHEDTRDFLAMVLAGGGYHVLTACNGQEALEMAEKHTPALIVMDFTMPVMDGVESALQIRSRPGLQTVPIIACTAYATLHDWPPGLFGVVLLKPVSPSDLLGALKAFLPDRARG